MGRLSDNALEFAKQHIEKYYDSDFFPKPFEFKAIWCNWKEVKEYLRTTEIKDLQVLPPRILAAPKGRTDFRIVHQLEPLNTIAYTA